MDGYMYAILVKMGLDMVIITVFLLRWDRYMYGIRVNMEQVYVLWKWDRYLNNGTVVNS